MQLIRSDFDLDGFFHRLLRAPARALILDYDGTLAPFRERRESAFPYPGVRESLTAIQSSGRTFLVLVSGRPVKSLQGLLGLSPPPEVWGSHGRERSRADRRETGGALHETDRRALKVLEEWIAREAGESALEKKPFGVAVHWRDRGHQDAGRLRRRAIQRFRSATAGTGLEVLEFEGGVEVRPRGDHKGTVIETLLQELPRGAAVAYLGDDRTDEDAFAALSGRGLSVLVRPALRPTAADLWLKPPEELLGFLDRWLEATRSPLPGQERE
jgi:trehalose-phosphatase